MATRAVCARIPNRSFIKIQGKNSAQLLNGLLSSTIPWPPRNGFYSAFLAANGKMLYDVFLWPIGDDAQPGYLIEYDPRPSEAPPLASLLKKHVLRSRVRVEEVHGQWDVWSAWGGTTTEPSRKWRFGSQGAVEPLWEDGLSAWSGNGSHVIRDLRAPGMGLRIIREQGRQPDEAQTHESGTAEDYTVHRILHGVPEGSKEFPAMSALPLNSNLDLMGGIDFHKGCYVGQELTVRTYHTGVVRRRIYPVQIYPENSAPREPATADPNIPEIEPTSIRSTEQKGTSARENRPSRLLIGLRGVGLAVLKSPPPIQPSDAPMLLENTGGVKYNVKPWIPSWWPGKSIFQRP